jgi:hypothetical protein
VTVEDRLRATAEAVTASMRPVRPLTLPPVPSPAGAPARQRERRPPRPRRGWGGWLIPLAAAVAVIAVAVTLVAVRSLPGARPAPASGETAPASLAGVPRYYVELGSMPQGTTSSGLIVGDALKGTSGPGLIVGDAFTGKVLATIPQPAGAVFTGVTGAGDDRTFVINARTTGKSSSRQPNNPSQLWYLLRVTPGAARPVQLTPLPVKDKYTDAAVSGLALSPDGRTLAIMVVPNALNPHLYPSDPQSLAHALPVGPVTLQTYAVPTGQLLRSWTHPWSGIALPPGEDNWADLLWLADGRTLAFEYPLSMGTETTKTSGTVLALDTAGPGTDLIASARTVLSIPDDFACEPGAGLLSPDGRTWFCAGNGPPAGCKTTGVTFSAYSTATGKRKDVLYRHVPCYGANPVIAWAGPGESMIGLLAITYQKGSRIVGLMAPGKFTPLKLALPHGLLGNILEPGWIAF